MDDIIKTTARFQEADQLVKLRPTIQITDNTTQLPNAIRASIDSGRDNPFRPDGEIYKSADPIVDYYKYGPNQSRNQSPSDDQLLINDTDLNKTKKFGKKQPKKSKSREEGKESCWLRWFCCRCCCKGKKQRNISIDQPVAPSTPTTAKEKQQSSFARIAVIEEEPKNPVSVSTLNQQPKNPTTLRSSIEQKQQQLSMNESPVSPEDTKQKGGHANERSKGRCVVS